MGKSHPGIYRHSFLLVFVVSFIFSGRLSAQAYDSLGRRLSLTEMSLNYPTDKNAMGHDYVQVYERLFEPQRDSIKRFFEIGILDGASHLMWRDYFPNAEIFGIDIKDYSEISTGTGVKTFVADQANRSDLQAFIDKYGGDFDVILDDGGHAMDHQQVSFGFLFKYLKPGGYYIIEDVHTSLPKYYPDPEFKVNASGSNTTLFMIEWFMRNEEIRSEYMLPEEINYLQENIDSMELTFIRTSRHSMGCIIRKRL